MNEQIQLEDVENLSNKEVPRTYIACNDERLNYTFCKKEDIDKVKKILDKVKFTKRDGKDVMLIEIGEGIELSIVQKKK